MTKIGTLMMAKILVRDRDMQAMLARISLDKSKYGFIPDTELSVIERLFRLLDDLGITYCDH